MLRYFKIGFWVLLGIILASFLHYTLPKRDVVYVSNTYNRVIAVGANSWFWASPDAGTVTPDGDISRDVLFIEAMRQSGRPAVYRNEDTGFWPPYFKFDSSNLQAEASNLKTNDTAAPRWVAVRYYGWRVPMFSIYPNAVSVYPVAGPDVRLIPWFNIIFLTVLAATFWAIRVRWNRFWERRRQARADVI